MRIKFRRSSTLALIVGALLLGACSNDDSVPTSTEADDWTYPYSHIVIKAEPERSDADARKLAFRIHARLLAGKSFAETAKRFSEGPSKIAGGFVGFRPAAGMNRFSGALQALPPGTHSQPVRTQVGYQILLRHTFDEGARLERKHMAPVYGVVVPWEGLEGGAGNTKQAAFEEAKRILKGVRGKVLDLDEEAARFIAPGKPRRDSFLGMYSVHGEGHPLMDPLRNLPVETFADVFETEMGWVVAKKGRHLRCALRQILVQHVESENRAIRVRRSKAEALQAAQTALSELKADRTKWGALVPRFSDDDTSIDINGWIGTFGNGGTPPNVEAVLLEMSRGDISSEVVESPEGFHIFWRVR